MATTTVKQQQKKQRKELKRRRRQKKEVVRKAQWTRACQFPKFEIDPDNDCPAEFVDAVYSAARKVNFDDRSQFGRFDRLFWECMAAHGFQRVEGIWEGMNEEFAASDPNCGDFMRQHSKNKLVQAIYKQIPLNVKTRFMPHNHFLIRPKGKVWQIQCKRMYSVSTPRGRVHFSFPPTLVDMDGQKKYLTFTTHALQRICERIAPKWKADYLELIRVVRFVAYIPYFEMTYLHDDQPAIVLFSYCGTSISEEHHIYETKILGENNPDSNKNNLEYRLGYCPIEMNEGVAVAKTFLPPGYKGTPEHHLLLQSRLPKFEKERLFLLAKDHIRDHKQADEWLPLVKWFHENGIPQVRHCLQNREEYLESKIEEFLEFVDCDEASCNDN